MTAEQIPIQWLLMTSNLNYSSQLVFKNMHIKYKYTTSRPKTETEEHPRKGELLNSWCSMNYGKL